LLPGLRPGSWLATDPPASAPVAGPASDRCPPRRASARRTYGGEPTATNCTSGSSSRVRSRVFPISIRPIYPVPLL
jgi:hypothetical protein